MPGIISLVSHLYNSSRFRGASPTLLAILVKSHHHHHRRQAAAVAVVAVVAVAGQPYRGPGGPADRVSPADLVDPRELGLTRQWWLSG